MHSGRKGLEPGLLSRCFSVPNSKHAPCPHGSPVKIVQRILAVHGIKTPLQAPGVPRRLLNGPWYFAPQRFCTCCSLRQEHTCPYASQHRTQSSQTLCVGLASAQLTCATQPCAPTALDASRGWAALLDMHLPEGRGLSLCLQGLPLASVYILCVNNLERLLNANGSSVGETTVKATSFVTVSDHAAASILALFTVPPVPAETASRPRASPARCRHRRAHLNSAAQTVSCQLLLLSSL